MCTLWEGWDMPQYVWEVEGLLELVLFPYFLFKVFFYITYSHYILFSFFNFSQVHPTSLPIQLHDLLALSKYRKQWKSKQTNKKYKHIKESTWKHGVHFVLASYSWTWGLPWNVIDKPREAALQKISLQQVFMANGFLAGAGLCVHPSLLCAGILSSRKLCRSRVCSPGVCVFLCAPGLLCLKALFLCIHLLPVALTVFSLLFNIDPWAWEGRFDENLSFRTDWSEVSHSLRVLQLWVSVLIIIYRNKRLLWCRALLWSEWVPANCLSFRIAKKDWVRSLLCGSCP